MGNSTILQIGGHFILSSDEVFLYGEYYSIQKLVDGNWFYAPTVEDVVVHDLAHELSPGASYTMTYSLLPYGELQIL